MGTFAMSCHLTGAVLGLGDEVVAIPVTENIGQGYRTSSTDSWSYWSPAPMILEGTYDAAGALEKGRVWDRKEALSQEQQETLIQSFVQFLHKNSNAQEELEKRNQKLTGSPSEQLQQLMHSRAKLYKPDPVLKDLEMLLKLKKEKAPLNEVQASYIDRMIGDSLKQLGLKTAEKALELLPKAKGPQNEVPLLWVFMNKKAFEKVLKEFGCSQKEKAKENYAAILQAQRSGAVAVDQAGIEVISGNPNYASSNRPLLTWETVVGKKERALQQKVHQQQALEGLLINDFCSLLGKRWFPSQPQYEELKNHGNIEALAMQQELIQDLMPKQKTSVRLKP